MFVFIIQYSRTQELLIKDGHGREVYGIEANYYDGHYANGVRQGEGTLIMNKNYTYVGGWKNNKLHGFGRYNRTDEKNNIHSYVGYFEENKFHGDVSICPISYMLNIS